MEQENPSATNNRWYPKLTWLSAGLFAVLWSLGDFFFWVFLGLTCAFAFLWIYHSGARISFNRPGPPPGQPYRGYRSPEPSEPVPMEAPKKVPRAAFILFMVFAGVMLFVYRVGKMAAHEIPDNETMILEDSLSSTEPVEENNLVVKLSDKANTSLGREDYDSALYYYNEALKLDARDPGIHYNIAVVYSTRSDFLRSNSSARQCLRIDPQYNYGWWLLGWNYYSLNMYDSAILSLDRGYSNHFDEPGFLRLIGDVSIKRNNRSRAIEMYKASLAKDSTTVELYETLAGLEPDKADWYRRKAAAFRK